MINTRFDPPSLKDATMQSIKTKLLSNHFTRLYLQKRQNDPLNIDMNNFVDTNSSIEDNLEKLPLMPDLKEELYQYKFFTDFEISWWMHFHDWLTCSFPIYPFLIWTAHGMIDGRKTAESLVREEGIPISQRFRLACYHCLDEDVIRSLDGPDHYGGKNCVNDPDYLGGFLISYWSYSLDNQLDEFVAKIEESHPNASFNRTAMDNCANSLSALKMFFEKLSAEEKKVFIQRHLERETWLTILNNSNFDIFIFNHIPETLLSEFFRTHKLNILTKLFSYDTYDLFMKVLKQLSWEAITGEDFVQIMIEILDDYYRSKKIFKILWAEAPQRLINYAIQDEKIAFMLDPVFRFKSIELFNIIMKEVEPEEHDSKMVIFFHFLIRQNDWNILEPMIWLILISVDKATQILERMDQVAQNSEDGYLIWFEYGKSRFAQILSNKFQI